MNTWKDIWKEKPPRGEDILFLTGDEEEHLGFCIGEEKLRKCEFYSYIRKDYYDCDKNTDLKDRVLFWYPLPEKIKN